MLHRQRSLYCSALWASWPWKANLFAGLERCLTWQSEGKDGWIRMIISQCPYLADAVGVLSFTVQKTTEKKLLQLPGSGILKCVLHVFASVTARAAAVTSFWQGRPCLIAPSAPLSLYLKQELRASLRVACFDNNQRQSGPYNFGVCKSAPGNQQGHHIHMTCNTLKHSLLTICGGLCLWSLKQEDFGEFKAILAYNVSKTQTHKDDTNKHANMEGGKVKTPCPTTGN